KHYTAKARGGFKFGRQGVNSRQAANRTYRSHTTYETYLSHKIDSLDQPSPRGRGSQRFLLPLAVLTRTTINATNPPAVSIKLSKIEAVRDATKPWWNSSLKA